MKWKIHPFLPLSREGVFSPFEKASVRRDLWRRGEGGDEGGFDFSFYKTD